MWFFSRDPTKDFHYEIGDVVPGLEDKSVWKIHKGKKKFAGHIIRGQDEHKLARLVMEGLVKGKKDRGRQRRVWGDDLKEWSKSTSIGQANNDPVSIFIFELKPGKENEFEIAKNCLKRLKTLRHPNVVTYIDSLEVTLMKGLDVVDYEIISHYQNFQQKVPPIRVINKLIFLKADKVLYLVTESVEPLEHHLETTGANNKQKSLAICWGLHQVIKGLSFLINDCGLSHNNVCMPTIFVDKAGEWKIGGVDYMSSSDYAPVKVQSELRKYNPPEANDAKINKWASDMWGFGCLIWEAFNGSLPKPASLKTLGKVIPKNLQSGYCELVAANPHSRPNPKDFMSKNKSGSGAYFNNGFIRSMLFLEEIQIKETSEKQQFFSNLSNNLDDFPSEICKYKILPQLLNAFDFGNAGSSVLGPLFKLSKLLNDDEYQKCIVPCVVKLFSLKDRATRIKLLQQMESLTDHLQSGTVNDAIFPQLVQGFMDTSPVIREETVKCMLYLAPKLNYNNLNVEVMKHLAKIQAKDEQGGIRTNTTVCLGKIACHLHPQTRQKVLIPAFSRAIRDQFSAARIAGILALSACQCFFTLNDSANKVLPTLCHLTAFRAINGYLSKLEKVSEDPSLAEEMEAQVNAGASSGITNAAATWAGWAVSSLTSKFYKTSLKNSSNSEKAKSPSPEVSKSSSDNALSTANSIEKSFSRITDEQSDENSDYEGKNDWNDDCGEMETGNNVLDPKKSEVDGWDDSGWDDMNVIPEESLTNASSTDGWSENVEDFEPIDSIGKPASSYDWSHSSINPDADEFFSSMAKSWDNNDFPEKDSDNQIQADLTRRAREERKGKRQKELQERRAARQGQGPMKLGDKQR
ncbi:N-terminal kinase-like protein [Nymphon striatum]|nr:N-terminal kinase-like protein [Nymphon striatum]